MSHFDKKLDRPYTSRVLIEAYIYTCRKDFVHSDFLEYYGSLLKVLETRFDVEMSYHTLSFDQKILWMLFESTVRSLLRVSSPWSNYLEAGLLHRKLRERPEINHPIEQASATIHDANRESMTAHYEMLETLFLAIFGNRPQVVTSKDLLADGFDDSREPDITDYYDYM